MKNWDVDLGHQHSGDRDEAKHSEKLGALYFRACKESLPVPKAHGSNIVQTLFILYNS